MSFNSNSIYIDELTARNLTVTGSTNISLNLPASLQSIANLTTNGGEIIYTTGTNTYATSIITAQARALLDDTTSSAQRSTLGVVIGTDVQAHSSGLDSISGISSVISANNILYSTAPDTWSQTSLTPFARTILDDVDATTVRSTIDTTQKAASTTNTAIVRWSGATGDALLNSGVLIDASNNISGVNDLNIGNNLTITGTLDGITAAERSQLTNIGVTTISAAQWGYLGNMDQNITTTSTPTFVGLNVSNNKIINVATPTNNTDAANKSYVDSVAGSGLSPIASCDVATATILPNTPTYSSPAQTLTAGANAAIVVDSVSLSLNNRVLVKDQADNRQNGVYVVTTVGSGATPWVLTRSSDFNQAATPITANSITFINLGTINAGSSWLLDNTVNNIDPLTDAVVWIQFSSQTVQAGSGLSLVGSTLSVNIASGRTVINGSNQVDIVVPVDVTSGGTGLTSLTNGNVLIGAGVAAVDVTKTAPAGDFVGTTDTQVLTNKTLTSTTNTIRTTQLATTGADVVINTAAPPSSGQVLKATSATAATWQTLSSNSFTDTITVAQSGGDYTSIQAAITAASALTPSLLNQILIIVYPGVYAETNPVIIPSFVFITSANMLRGGSLPVRIVPITSTSTAIVQLSSSSTIAGIIVSGANTAGGIGFYAPSGTINGFANNCAAQDCETGFQATGPNCTMGVPNCLAIGTTTTTLVTGFKVTNGATMTTSISSAISATGGTPITTGFYCTGANSRIVATSIYSLLCTTGFIVENGTAGNEAIIDVISGIIELSDTGISVGANAICDINGTNIINTVNNDVELLSSSSVLQGAGNTFRNDKLSLVNGSRIIGSFLSDTPGEPSFSIRGELSVGSVINPVESSFGGGDSHVLGMKVLKTSNDVVFTDVTSIVSLSDSVTTPAFNSTGVGERLYIGGTLASFPGIKIKIDTTILPASGITVATGVRHLTYEFWNGSTWVSLKYMSSDSNYPYLPHSDESFDSGSYQYRFGTMTNWTQTTINGVFAYWVRISINTILTQIPTIDQIKLHSHRTEINSDGFTEYFGRAEPIARLPFDVNWFVAAVNSPGSTDVFIEDTIAVGRNENSFSNNQDQRSGFMTELPLDIDTSRPLTIRFRFMVTSGSPGNMIIVIRYGYNVDVQDDPSPTGTTISSVFSSTADAPTTAVGRLAVINDTISVAANVHNRILSKEYQLDVSKLRAARSTGSTFGDMLWVTLERTGSDVADTYPGSANLIQVTPFYRKWCTGAAQ